MPTSRRPSTRSRRAGPIDILVNNVWGGYERMVENGAVHLGQAILGAAAVAVGRDVRGRRPGALSREPLAAPAMIARRRGLIVNISFWAAQKQIGNVAYGVSKAATDKMTADMAVELSPSASPSCRCIPGWSGRRRSWRRRSGST